MEAAVKQAPICGVFGRRGVGKTTLAREIARHQARLVVWDYLSEHGCLAFRSEGDLESLAEYWGGARGQQFAAARYIPRAGTVEEFEEWCSVVYGFRDCVLVVEEVAAVAQASYLPPAFGRVVRQGRHRGLGLLWTTQRLNEVSRTLTSLTDYWAGFNLSEPIDLQALASRCGREYADRVSKLPRFSWLGYDVDTQETFEDMERFKALWGSPPKWRFPVPQAAKGAAE
jgi:hypothetical protein